MAQLLNNLFGGSKTTAQAIPTADSGKLLSLPSQTFCRMRNAQ